MKAGWEVKRLGDFSEIRYGYTASASHVPIGPKFLRITDIQNGEVDWEKVPYCEVEDSKRKLFELNVGDIVFARTGATTGKSYLIKDEVDAIFASYLIKVRSMDSRLDSNFLALYFQTSKYWDTIVLGTEGAAQGGFNASKLATLRIPLPPLEEQKRIVAILDDAFEGLTRARAHTETNLQNARDLFDFALADTISVAEQKFGTEELGDHCDFQNGFAFQSSRFTETGEPILRISNIQGGSIDDTKTVFTNTAAYKEDLSRYRVQPGDLLIAMSGATTGKVGFNRTDRIYLQNQRVGRFCPTQSLRLEFLYYFLTTKIEENLAISAGAAQPNLSTRQIKEIRLPVPALRDQDAFLEKIATLEAEIRDLQSHYRAKLAELDALRQSLLQKAFAGELT